MKKIITILLMATGLKGMYAQGEIQNKNSNFNKWSIEAAGGFNKVQRPLSDGYYTALVSPFVADLGVRYMFNNEFGLKADFGLNSITGKSSSLDFDTKYYRFDLQGVANLGRIMNFETWTNTFGLLGHAGFGVGQIENRNNHVNDRVGNFIAGVTGQIKVTDRIAITGDFSTILNASQDIAFNGSLLNSNRGFSGLLFNTTIGLNVYLGKSLKHADWIVLQNPEIGILENKLADLENLISKQEPKTVIVEKQVAEIPVEKDLVKNMINDRYFSVYFDFNKAVPIENSTAAIDVILNYLRNNPKSNLEIYGNADQIGSSEYNNNLSDLRARNVKEILVKAGVEPSRLVAIARGADASIAKDSDEARRLARRVTFRVN